MFLNHLDAIYCINLPSNTNRKEFMDQQFQKYNIQNVKYLKAYNTQDQTVQSIIKDRLVYPILISTVAQVAISHSFLEVWKDIAKHNYQMALILEDDAKFDERFLEIGNQTISPEKFAQIGINMTRPYVVHLAGNGLIKRSHPDTPIKLHASPVKYGNVGYITNHHMCRLLINSFYPITMPCDDYLYQIKTNYKVKQGHVMPVMVRQLRKVQANNFQRLSYKMSYQPYIQTIELKNLLLPTNELNDKINAYVYHKITGSWPIIDNHNTPHFAIGPVLNINHNSMVCGTSLTNGIPVKPLFIFSLLGWNSYHKLKYKHKNMARIFGDMPLLLSKYYTPKTTPNTDQPLTINDHQGTVEQLIDQLYQHKTINTNNLTILMIAHSYQIPTNWTGQLTPQVLDYYSIYHIKPNAQPEFPIDTNMYETSLPFSNHGKKQFVRYYQRYRR